MIKVTSDHNTAEWYLLQSQRAHILNSQSILLILYKSNCPAKIAHTQQLTSKVPYFARLYSITQAQSAVYTGPTGPAGWYQCGMYRLTCANKLSLNTVT